MFHLISDNIISNFLYNFSSVSLKLRNAQCDFLADLLCSYRGANIAVYTLKGSINII